MNESGQPPDGIQLIELYWAIGKAILDRQKAEGWGTRVIDRLSDDLRAAYPDMKGLSRSNIKYMRQMAAAWPGDAIGQQAVGQLPWGHVTVLPGEDSELAAQIAKDPYVFDFLGLSGRVAERELQAVLVARLRSTLLR